MSNFIVRTITGIFFVAAIVVSFIDPTAMALLFALVTGLTVWEFTGLVNQRDGVDTNRMICTVAGVYFFLAMIGFCSELTPSAVFIPYLITITYLFVAELYAKNPAASAFSMLWAMESVVALAWFIRMDIESLYTATESVAPRALATESAVAVASAVATGATACATTGCACAAIIMQMAAMRIADIMIVRLNFRPGYLFSDCRERS